MGKDLRGKELGVGISQRKDGLYTARFTDKLGKRRQQYFRKLQECRQWLADAQFEDEHGNVLQGENPTVDAWFEYWIDNIKGNTLRKNSLKDYKNKYEKHIKPFIGNMLLNDVKPLHCQNILSNMADNHADSVIRGCRFVMQTMFYSAVENELITKNPVTKSIQAKSRKLSVEKNALTVREQVLLLSASEKSTFYNEWALILQTGLRVGELTALRWTDVDFKSKMLHVGKTMSYNHADQKWEDGVPKTKSSIRDIPLTQEAIRILKKQREKRNKITIVSIDFSDLVFLNKFGRPTARSTYDEALKRKCDKIGIKRISMHILRHTYATRCIEAGMRPKTLQMILGHSNISMTMDLYVHVSNEEKIKEVEDVECKLKLV